MITTDGGNIVLTIFIISLANCCLNLAILLLLVRSTSEKKLEEREEMLMRFLIIICILICSCAAQDESIDPWLDDDPPITIIDDKPVLFPDAIPKAAQTIEIIFEGQPPELNLTSWDAGWAAWLAGINQSNLTF